MEVAIFDLRGVALPASDATGSKTTYKVIQLSHPGTNLPGSFVVALRDGKPVSLLETTRAKDVDQRRSWFVGDEVVRDGGLTLGTQVDPLFLVLPFLETANRQGRSSPLSDILSAQASPHVYRYLRPLITLERAKRVCRIINVEGMEPCVRLDKDLVMKWLVGKVKRASKALARMSVEATSVSSSSSFVLSSEQSASNAIDSAEKKSVQQEREAEHTALQLVCDYLPTAWRTALCDELGWKLSEVLALQPLKVEEGASNGHGGVAQSGQGAVRDGAAPNHLAASFKRPSDAPGPSEAFKRPKVAPPPKAIPPGAQRITSFFGKKST